MIEVDVHAEARRAWLREEHEPRVTLQSNQSDFEESPHWRVCLAIAVVVIGFNVLSPDPEAPAPTSHAARVTT